MPGLVDAHVHVSGYREGLPAGAPFEPSKCFMRLCLYNGVTAVRDTGNTVETLLYLRLWGAKYSGTRMYGAGPLLDAPPPIWPHTRIVQDCEDARRHVECLHMAGVDLVKTYRHITPEQTEAVVAAARAHDLPVAADCGSTTAREAARLGVSSLEHAANLVDDVALGFADTNPPGSTDRARAWNTLRLDSSGVLSLVELLLERGTWVCPTLLVSRRWCLIDEMVEDPYLDYAALVMPYHRYLKRMRGAIGMAIGQRSMRNFLPIPRLDKEQKREVQGGLALMGELTARLQAAGVRIALGTDSPNPSLAPGFSLHQELAHLVKSGVPELEALRCATSSSGELVGDADLGVLRPGSYADLLLLDGDPTRDIGALDRIAGVMCRGQWVDRDKLGGQLQESMHSLEEAS
jgi:imidazolonepropionase-like amidohydrolase